MRIIFAGTPDFAAVALQALLDQGHQICAVYCQPDRPSGRGKKLVAGPVKQLAIEQGIAVEQPINFKSDAALNQLNAYQADLMIVVAYGLLLPAAVLDCPRYGCVNIHGSLLPRWRGAAPIQRAIQNGDSQTGITIMQMDQGLDTGPMLLKLSCDIDPLETGSSLHDKLALLGGQAINQFLAEFDLNQPTLVGEAQNNELATYAHKLSKQEAQIDWTQSAQSIEQQVRAFNAWPVCFTYVGERRIRVWAVQLTDNSSAQINSAQIAGKIVNLTKSSIEVVCGDGRTLLLTELQPDGSRMMSCEALLNARYDWFVQHPQLGSYAG